MAEIALFSPSCADFIDAVNVVRRVFGSTPEAQSALAFAIAYIALPDAWLMGPYDEHSFGVRTVFFFYLILAFSGLSVLYGYSRLKNFSNSLWNSPYTD
jgi:hypothetical protein